MGSIATYQCRDGSSDVCTTQCTSDGVWEPNTNSTLDCTTPGKVDWITCKPFGLMVIVEHLYFLCIVIMTATVLHIIIGVIIIMIIMGCIYMHNCCIYLEQKDK